jgi:hypothetical protein
VPDLQSAEGGLMQLPHSAAVYPLQLSEVRTSLQYVGQQTLSTRVQLPQLPLADGTGYGD